MSPVREADNFATFKYWQSKKFGSLDLLEP